MAPLQRLTEGLWVRASISNQSFDSFADSNRGGFRTISMESMDKEGS
jgi:hypothetical protein